LPPDVRLDATGPPRDGAARQATEARRATEETVRRRWSDVPLDTHHLPHWAQTVAHRHADGDPRVIRGDADADLADRQLRDPTEHRANTRAALQQTIGGARS
jgi:hypothetical protein